MLSIKRILDDPTSPQLQKIQGWSNWRLSVRDSIFLSLSLILARWNGPSRIKTDFGVMPQECQYCLKKAPQNIDDFRQLKIDLTALNAACCCLQVFFCYRWSHFLSKLDDYPDWIVIMIWIVVFIHCILGFMWRFARLYTGLTASLPQLFLCHKVGKAINNLIIDSSL